MHTTRCGVAYQARRSDELSVAGMRIYCSRVVLMLLGGGVALTGAHVQPAVIQLLCERCTSELARLHIVGRLRTCTAAPFYPAPSSTRGQGGSGGAGDAPHEPRGYAWAGASRWIEYHHIAPSRGTQRAPNKQPLPYRASIACSYASCMAEREREPQKCVAYSRRCVRERKKRPGHGPRASCISNGGGA